MFFTGGGDFPPQEIVIVGSDEISWTYWIVGVVVPVAIAIMHMWRQK